MLITKNYNDNNISNADNDDNDHCVSGGASGRDSVDGGGDSVKWLLRWYWLWHRQLW